MFTFQSPQAHLKCRNLTSVLKAYTLQLQTLLAQSSRYFSFYPIPADGLRLGNSSAQYGRVQEWLWGILGAEEKDYRAVSVFCSGTYLDRQTFYMTSHLGFDDHVPMCCRWLRVRLC